MAMLGDLPPTRLTFFIAGGIGIVVLFGLCAGLAVGMGGTATLDPCGLVCLFTVGGGAGLIAYFIYHKGKQSGQSDWPPYDR